MFNPEKEVPSLELCRRLKELGYPQEGGGYYWISFGERYILISYAEIEFDGNKHPWGIHSPSGLSQPFDYIIAPTLRELGEWLPHQIIHDGKAYFLDIGLDNIDYEAYDDSWIKQVIDQSEPNVRAKMVIWLKENGYITFEKEDK